MKNILLLSLFLFLSCSDDSFKKVEKLGEFRILGIQASNPEITDDTDVTNVSFSLLISDKDAGGRTIPVSIEGCIDPGVAYGAQPNCDGIPGKFTSPITTIDTTTLNAPHYTGLLSPGITIPISKNILTNRSSRDQFNGASYLVTFKFDVEGKEVSSFKRIIVTKREDNAGNVNASNPTFLPEDFLLNGTPINQAPKEGDKLSINPGQPDSYQYQNINGDIELKTEKFEVAWYSSHGEFSKPKSFTQEKVEFKSDSPTEPSVFVVVIRDGRGGLSYLMEEFP